MANPVQRGSLEIVVADVDRRPVVGANIRCAGAQPVAAGPGRYVVADVPLGRIDVDVEAEGFEDDHRVVDVVAGRNLVNVVLARPGLPAFKRRGGRVPFRSPEDRWVWRRPVPRLQTSSSAGPSIGSFVSSGPMGRRWQ
jgi:hypothetical protein